METQSLTKQFLIQLGINVLASAIVSYIMIKLLQPKEDSTTTALVKSQTGASTPAGSTSTSTTTTPTV